MEIDKIKFLVAMARSKQSITSLSNASGIGRVTLSALKNGRLATVEPLTLGKLADALGVDVTELIKDRKEVAT